MRKPAFVRFLFVALLVVSVVAFAPGRTGGNASAASTAIAASSAPYFDIPGLFFNSYASLTQAVSASDTSINITDAGCLRVGWTIQVQDSIIAQPEWMLITQLIPATSGNPDTMVVSRGQGGTTASAHAAGVVVQTRAVSIDIMAQNVSTAEGLGAFTVEVKPPSQFQLIEFVYDTAWLSSTGRSPSCLSAYQVSPGVWDVRCATLGATPLGPNGSGRIARLTVLPTTTVGSYIAPLTGSNLLDIEGNSIAATLFAISIPVVNCPDTNLDGSINSTDLLNVAKNLNDEGADSGATISNNITASQTQIAISNKNVLSATAPNNIIAIDNEEMTVVSLAGGSPNTMTVTRSTYYRTAASHTSGSHIYRATADGYPQNGVWGYTPSRDVIMDGVLNSTDLLRVAKMMPVAPDCPVPP